MQYRAHAGGRMVRLQVARPGPHEGADAVADADAGIAQRMRQLVRAIAGLEVGLAAGTGLGGGDDLGLGRHRGTAVDEPRHHERRALHPHAPRLPIGPRAAVGSASTTSE